MLAHDSVVLEFEEFKGGFITTFFHKSWHLQVVLLTLESTYKICIQFLFNSQYHFVIPVVLILAQNVSRVQEFSFCDFWHF